MYAEDDELFEVIDETSAYTRSQTILDHLARSWAPKDIIDVSQRASTTTPIDESTEETPTDLYGRVKALHDAGDFIASADAMLNYVVDKIEVEDFDTISELIELQAYALNKEPDSFGDRGLALVHNVLALTFRQRDRFPSRERLRARYHQAVSRYEDIDAADNAVADL
jgi:hypothetical protein